MGNQNAEDKRHTEDKRLNTLSTDARRLIGQAIIDGLLTPTGVSADQPKDYNQGSGNYTQKGGDHRQSGPGDYNQSPASIFNFPDLVSIISRANVIREE